jgi:hypothetical protein
VSWVCGRHGDLASLAFGVLALRSPAAGSLAGKGIRDPPAALACGPGHVRSASKWHTWLGLGHDQAWEYAYISGKPTILRWVFGSEWDFLDT